MDDGPYTDDLNLDAIRARADLAAQLRIVHIRADKPALRTLEARTRHDTTPLSKTVVAEMLNGSRFPRKVVMLGFLRACGLTDQAIEPWLRAWERVAAAEESASRPGREENPSSTVEELRTMVSRLSNDNEKLRTQLAGARSLSDENPLAERVGHTRSTRSPIARRRELGTLLKARRTAVNLTVEQVADHLMCSSAKVKRMESGFRSGTIRDVRDLCGLYRVTDTAERNHLMQLARESKQAGWWQPYNLPFSNYVGLEADAVSIKTFDCTCVNGLLQTEDYARAIQASSMPHLDPETIEERVEVRLMRQRRFAEANPPHVRSILDEAALHRTIGGVEVMRAQLKHLIQAASLSNVTLQIVPYDAGSYSAMDSPFAVLEFTPPVESVAYSEGLMGFVYMERPAGVASLASAFDAVSDVALNEKDSVVLIEKIRNQLG